MDAKKINLNEELMKTLEGRNMILENIIRNEGVTGYFAIDKIETVVKEAVVANKIDEDVAANIFKYINLAYNLMNKNDPENETETPFKKAIEELIKEQKQSFKDEEAKVKKNKKI